MELGLGGCVCVCMYGYAREQPKTNGKSKTHVGERETDWRGGDEGTATTDRQTNESKLRDRVIKVETNTSKTKKKLCLHVF